MARMPKASVAISRVSMSQEELQNLYDYIEFKLNFPDFKGCAYCKELQKDESEPRDCERCSAKFGPKGIIELSSESRGEGDGDRRGACPTNREAWDLAEKIYYLGPELAIALRGGLELTQDEAYWLGEKLAVIIQYLRGQEAQRHPRLF